MNTEYDEITVDIKHSVNEGRKRLCYLHPMNISGKEHAPFNFIKEVKPKNSVLSFSGVCVNITTGNNGEIVKVENWPIGCAGYVEHNPEFVNETRRELKMTEVFIG